MATPDHRLRVVGVDRRAGRMTSPLRAALYARVSTDLQTEKFGLPSQLRELRALATRRGYTVIGEFVDDGYSGALLERPQLTVLRDLVRDRGVDVVLAHSSDRLSRELVHLLLLSDELRRAGVQLEYVSHLPDATPEGDFREQVLGAVAQLERAKIRERTIRGRREKARRGAVPSGPVTFGYRRDPQGSGGYAIDETAAAVVRRIFEWCIAGTSVRQIVRRLSTQGIPSPRGAGWGTASVRRMLTNETYIGRAYYDRRTRAGALRDRSEWIDVAVPVLIPPSLWHRAQAALCHHARVLVGRPAPIPSLLRGLCRCACGHALVGQQSHGRRLYRCAARYRVDGRTSCQAPTLGAKRLETMVWNAVTAYLRDPNLLENSARTSRRDLRARQVQGAEHVAEVRRALAKVQQARERLLDLYLTGVRDKATFTLRDQVLAQEEERLQAEATRLEAAHTVAAGAR